MIVKLVPDNVSHIRLHPYEPGGRDPRVRYHDFRNHPELIPVSLEDFRPWEHYEAIDRFYDLLRSLNSNESAFESNDSGFALRPERGFGLDARVVAGGRVMIFLRDLIHNLSTTKIGFLKGLLCEGIREVQPEFTGGHIDVSMALACFSALPGADEDKVGAEFVLEFYALGETEEEAMSNLSVLITGLHAALKLASARWDRDGILKSGSEATSRTRSTCAIRGQELLVPRRPRAAEFTSASQTGSRVSPSTLSSPSRARLAEHPEMLVAAKRRALLARVID